MKNLKGKVIYLYNIDTFQACSDYFLDQIDGRGKYDRNHRRKYKRLMNILNEYIKRYIDMIPKKKGKAQNG